ncbi:MAG: SHOCT domain-containing protein [Candidatus Parcubacteria bacterium]|nr:SHOCT domain-containing protein [Candidatus Parcubacteria bacterium]
MMGYYNYDFYPRHNGFEIVIAVLCWIAVVSFVIFLVKRFGMCHGRRCGHMGGFHGGSALDILKERYAKGEIDKKEFESMKKEIEG